MTKNIYQIVKQYVSETPNDQELGKKIRILFNTLHLYDIPLQVENPWKYETTSTLDKTNNKTKQILKD